jgi:hypothetical protein
MGEKIGDLWRIGAARITTHGTRGAAAMPHRRSANKADFTALFATNSAGGAALHVLLLNLNPTVKW